MKPLNDQSKDELLQTVSEIIERVNSIKIKFDQLESFHQSIFNNSETQPSIESRIQNFIEQAQLDNKNIESFRNSIVSYYNEVLTDAESKLSIKTQMTNYLEKVKSDVSAIENSKNTVAEYNNELFKDIEGRVSIKNQITNFFANIEADSKKIGEIKNTLETYVNDTLVGSASQESTKSKIDNLLSGNLSKINEIKAYHRKLLVEDEGNPSLSEKYQKAYNDISQAHNELLIGDNKNQSVKSKINTLHDTAGSVRKEVQHILETIKVFQKEVFEEYTDPQGNVQMGLKDMTEHLRGTLDGLINETAKTLHSLTDKSLHNSFRSRARKYSEEYKILQKYTFICIFSIAAITLGFGIAQLINVYGFNNKFSYNMEIYQLGITLPFVYAVWMLNRNQKIAKKLAEEYHHKASLAEAMTGYRALYRLNHDSQEYMTLFNGIKEQLNNNPSTTIDKFLNLKSPTESLVKESSKIINPDTLVSTVEKTISK